MADTQSSTLSDFPTPAAETDLNADEEHWPVEVNGHSISIVEPNEMVTGSGDPDVAFECENCGKHVTVSASRSIPDHEYANNRFAYVPCRTKRRLTN